MSKLKTLRRGAVLAAVVGAVLMSAGPASATPPGQGSADALTIDIRLGGGAVPVGLVGPLAQSYSTGPTSANVADVDLPGLIRAGVMQTHSTFDPAAGVVHSDASIANVDLRVLSGLLPLLGTGPYTVGAVESHCDSTTPLPPGFVGDSKVADVKLGTTAIPVAFPPNTNIGIPGIAEIIFNEQILLSDGSFSVTAIHIKLLGSLAALLNGDIWLARSICGAGAVPIPLASGAGLWVGLALLGAIAVPAGVVIVRRRRAAIATAAE